MSFEIWMLIAAIVTFIALLVWAVIENNRTQKSVIEEVARLKDVEETLHNLSLKADQRAHEIKDLTTYRPERSWRIHD